MDGFDATRKDYTNLGLFVYDPTAGKLFYNQTGIKDAKELYPLVAILDNRAFLSTSDLTWTP
jgi:hypothetical protein